jgi:fructose-1,6-bisphosphatase I
MTVDTVFETVAGAASDVQSVLGDRRSYEGGHNPSGERQLAADVYADDLLAERLLALDTVASYASEERETVQTSADDGDGPAPGDAAGTYHISCDPLDGSSNLTSNNAMGTIVGIYDRALPAPGSALVGAAYVLYGPITTMVTAHDDTVREYLLEDGQRDLLDGDVSLPGDPVTYGFGGRIPDWPSAFAEYVADIEADRLKLRYAGAMVADVNQVLTYGGIFGYPMVEGRPEGKLRLQFEGVPMAAIVAAAGGASTDGERSLLEKPVDDLHERSPVFVGSESLVDRLEDAMTEWEP